MEDARGGRDDGDPPASGPASATARAEFDDMALLACVASLASDASNATSKIGVMAALASADIPMRGLRIAVCPPLDDLAIAAALVFEEYEWRDGPRVVRKHNAAGTPDGVERLLQLNRWPPAWSAQHAASLDKAAMVLTNLLGKKKYAASIHKAATDDAYVASGRQAAWYDEYVASGRKAAIDDAYVASGRKAEAYAEYA